MLTLGAAGAGGSMGLMIFVVIMFVGMYFLSIRPQKKQQQKRQEMLKGMNKGDKVVTLGGIKGVIASIDRNNKEVVVDCDGIYLTFDLNFIRRAEPGNSVTAAKEDSAETKNEKSEAPAEEPKKAETEKVETADEKPAEEPKAEESKDAEDTKEETK
ncbi:preprotein translocase subunit YajC [Companilactobacillus farciminis]|uniref:preprotein translocase subunit YajC n=1 Tax=Companilactobacillus farciminis TaxID=1612 RepID=UPI00233050FD|nr:preprotein translocase subunit YajC [Companilactobacillus farciminis]WCG36827.1 preprotein translocase subunit YajC [Companilactobacillus farciminis]